MKKAVDVSYQWRNEFLVKQKSKDVLLPELSVLKAEMIDRMESPQNYRCTVLNEWPQWGLLPCMGQLEQYFMQHAEPTFFISMTGPNPEHESQAKPNRVLPK